MHHLLEFIGDILNIAAWSTPKSEAGMDTDTIVAIAAVLVVAAVALIFYLRYF